MLNDFRFSRCFCSNNSDKFSIKMDRFETEIEIKFLKKTKVQNCTPGLEIDVALNFQSFKRLH